MGCGSCGDKNSCIFGKMNEDHENHGDECHNHDHHHDHNHEHDHEHSYDHEHNHEHNCEHEHKHDHEHGYEIACECGHHHHHDHHHNQLDSKGLKKRLIKIIITLVLFLAVFITDKVVDLASINPGPANWVLPFVCYFIVYLILGLEIIKEAFHGIAHGELLDENFLMMIASFGAFALGIYKGCIGEEPDGFEEGCAVIIFYSIGEFFQSWALGKSRKSIADLMNIRPEHAHRIVESTAVSADGEIITETIEVEGKTYACETVPPEKVGIGEIFIIKQGEKVPIDGALVNSSGLFDTMALTGESEYENISSGGEVLSGSIYMGETPAIVKSTKEYHDSTVAKILYLVETASDRKAKAETFIARFARIYTPIVVGLAIAVAIIPPIVGLIAAGSINTDLSWTTWIYRALSFLVVSCPCALVISIPLSFTMGISSASKYHILIKGSNCIELISKANIFVSDKTGTLTVGRDIKPEAKGLVAWMKKIGAKLYVLSGDKKEIVESVANELGIEDYSYELKPQDKFERLESIIDNKGERDVVVYIGDGINDAPSLIRADVGISMGSIGSDAAVEASNIVLMRDNLSGIPILKKIANQTMLIVKENIIFSIGIKVIVLILSVFGISNMWVAVFADVGVCFLAVLNALRVGLPKYDKTNN